MSLRGFFTDDFLATMKGAAAPFYTVTNSDSRKKGGAACVVDLQSAYNQDR
jgi:hypothetical protein